jgi:hypothetical protein
MTQLPNAVSVSPFRVTVVGRTSVDLPTIESSYAARAALSPATMPWPALAESFEAETALCSRPVHAVTAARRPNRIRFIDECQSRPNALVQLQAHLTMRAQRANRQVLVSCNVR